MATAGNTMDLHNERLKQVIGRTLRQIAAFQLAQYINSEWPQVIELSDYKAGQVLANEMILITVSSSSLKMLFKLHFNPLQAKSHFATRIAQSQSTTQSEHHHNDVEKNAPLCHRDIDFMKELSNRICGCFSRKIAEINIELGLSIPLCTKGYYEIYSEYHNPGSTFIRFNDCWKLKDMFGELYCSYTFEVTDDAIIQPLFTLTNDLPSNHGQIEFL